jgi:arginyl-tRNA synthetase
MSSLTDILTEFVREAFQAEALPTEHAGVTPSNRPDLGQFQSNGALAVAKSLKRNPREIAERIRATLLARHAAELRDVSLAGPGFVNISLTDGFLAAHLNRLTEDERLGVARKPAETVILDYGGPNVAKPMHVGHLRAAIIGDALRRLFLFVGDRALGDVHLGDWGLPMGQVIAEVARRQPNLPYFEPVPSGRYPRESPVTLEDLEEIYPVASAACKSDPARLQEARAITAELQAGRPGYRALWRHFVEVSIAAMQRDYGALGVHFDLWKGEADVHDLIQPMIDGMTARAIAEESEGALVVRVAEPDDKHEVPPLILTKSDGAVMYGTTDLATIVDRVRSHDPDLILYVVDQRQHLHFEQVFRAARRAGLMGRAQTEHLGFGTMNGPDGKPFKTRAGGVMKLQDLIAMATEEATKRLTEAGLAADYPADERQAIASLVGIAALKFADLSNHRTSNYIFDLERFTRFEGKTGPYVQYAAVRIKSLLRKATEQGDSPGRLLPPTDIERPLALLLGRLPDAVAAAHSRRAPNELCEFGFSLAQEFSRFYSACHILSETDADLRASRLRLAELTLRELELVLSLLGIEVPERM